MWLWCGCGVGGTSELGIASSAADVLWMCVMRGMRGFNGLCKMCMCLARAGRSDERMRG